MLFSTCDSTCIHQLISSSPSSTHNGRKQRNHRYDSCTAASSRQYVAPVFSEVNNNTDGEPQRRRQPTTLPSNQPAQPSLAPSRTQVQAAQASLLPPPLPPPSPPPNRLSQKRNKVLVQDLTSSSSRTISRGTTLSNYQYTISLQPGKQHQARQVTEYRLPTTWIGSLTYQEGRRVEPLCGRCWIRQCGTMWFDLGGREET